MHKVLLYSIYLYYRCAQEEKEEEVKDVEVTEVEGSPGVVVHGP